MWTANDDPTGKPNWSNTADVYGVDAAEAKVAGKSVSPGWVRKITGTGGVTLTLVSGGSGYANADVITVDGVATTGVVNATANVIVGFSANGAGTVAVTSASANVVGTGTSFNTLFANGDQLFVYANSTVANTRTINQVVNSTFMNITSTWSTTNASATYGVAGVIQSVVPNNGGGSGFQTTSNVAITTSGGLRANVTATIGGRGGRVSYENMVIVRGMAGDAEDIEFPDS